MSISTMYDLTPRSFQNYYSGFEKSESSKLKQGWEQVRWVAYYAAIGHLKKGTKKDDLLKFPWDHVADVPKGMPSQEEIDASKKYWEEIDKKRNGQSDH